MNGEILQIVALCCHANGAIRGVDAGDVRGFAFDICDSIRFVRASRTLLGRTRDRTFASSPREWLATLKADGVRRVRLGHAAGNDATVADRNLAAFIGGGGTWYLELVRDAGQSSYLRAGWVVDRARATDSKMWRATYAQVTGPSTNAGAQSVPHAIAQLKDALNEIARFADRQHLSNWHANFVAALDAFDPAKPARFDNCADLTPPGVLPPDARTLLDACQRAWVFGGMGSWNDLGFQEPDQSEYDRVSERLYQAVVNGLIAGANATALP